MAMAHPTHPGPTVDVGRDEEGILTPIQGQEARTDILLCPEQNWNLSHFSRQQKGD
jgi:hypothetical protein